MNPLPCSPRGPAAALLAALAALALPPGAPAQTSTCIPFAVGVPAAPGPPVWWSGAVPAVFATKVNDPRWQGSVAHTFLPGGTGEQVRFRALVNNEGGARALYLSWHVKVDPSLDNNQDLLYVGFQPAPGQDPLILQVVAYNTSAATTEAVAPAGITALRFTGGAWTTAPTPAWAPSRTRVWLKNTSPYEWAVQMHVPVNALGYDQGIDLPEPFRLWYEVQVQANASSVPYHWPRTVADVHLDPVTFQNVYPATADWGLFRTGTGAGDPQCAIGVSLAWNDVGTTNTPDSRINLTSPNTFFARPLNQTGSTIPANGLRATFRVANWGSQPDWNQVADPSQLWADVPNGTLVPNAAPIPNGAQGNITFNWTLNAAEQAQFTGTPPARRPHQCMLVELSSTASLTLLNSSVYRNMDFVEASEFERRAQISVRGLRPGVGGVPERLPAAHPVTVFTERRNLPADAAKAARVDTAGVWDPRELRMLYTLSQYPDETLEAMAAADSIPPELLARLLPTYVVHVYRGDGRRVQKPGGVFPIAQAQNPFGYFIKHQGPLAGWRTAIGGVSRTETPNVYTLQVPRGGVADIVNRVVSEPDRPAPAGVEEVVQITPEPGDGGPGPGPGGGSQLPCGGGAGMLLALVAVAGLGVRRRPRARG